MTRSRNNREFYFLVARRLTLPLILIALAVVYLSVEGSARILVAAIGIVAAVIQIILAVRRRRQASMNRKQD